MTDNTRNKLIAFLLRMASDEFGNHGCNDLFLKRELGFSDQECDEVHSMVEKSNGDKMDHRTDLQTDWMVMDALADLLERE